MASVFRVNLYTERDERQRAGQRRAVHTAFTALFLCLNFLAVGTLFLSATLLAERRDSVAGDVPRLTAKLATESAPTRDLDLAREMFRIKTGRMDWSPKLAAIADLIEADLELHEIHAEAARKKTPASLEIRGTVAESQDNLEDVSRYVKALSQDERILDGFSQAKLGTIRSGEGEFQIFCETEAP